MDGIFFNVKNNLVRLIRFYDDGFVIGTSISSSDFESSNENLNWFNREQYNSQWRKGNYTLKTESVSSFTNDYVTFSFELISNQGGVLYSGYIINSEKIHLTFQKESEENNSEETSFKWLNNEDYEQLIFNRFHSDTELEIDFGRYQGNLGLMIKFKANKLLEEFSEQYVIENGKDKFDKLGEVIKNSEEVKNYITHLKSKAIKPSSDDLQYIMNTHKYFRWSKEETVCLGGLATILIWSYSGADEEKDEIVVKIMAKFIDHCSKLKYNQFDNFFHRFYRKLKIKLDSNQT